MLLLAIYVDMVLRSGCHWTSGWHRVVVLPHVLVLVVDKVGSIRGDGRGEVSIKSHMSTMSFLRRAVDVTML